ncbi:nuclear transport factor 2 family protein [Streptomyces sp. NPDC086091]|uniref:nuclear transport factor 2 family protein n=1 Tax=Streptomyces sp. NPDC086091 TaxID=3365751 RepID=UPI003806CF42
MTDPHTPDSPHTSDAPDASRAPDAPVTPLALADLPEVVGRYLRAHDARDTEAALATLAPGASITDEGRTHTGATGVRAWLERAGGAYTYTTTPVRAEREGRDRCTVVQHLEGDFPGGTVDLRFRFALDEHGLIRDLVIAP